MELNKEFKQRLLCEYRYSEKMNKDSMLFLAESYGVPSIVDALSLVFKDRIKKYIAHLEKRGDATVEMFINNQTLREYNISIESLFCLNFLSEITLSLGDKNIGNFSYVAYEDNFDDEKLIDCYINGNYIIDKNNIELSIDRSTSLFCHELLHAYEDYERQKNNKESLYDNGLKYGYDKNNAKNDDKSNINKRRLSYIIYYLTPMEIRAYCTQLIKQVENRISKCISSEDAFNIIKDTNIWKNYETIEEWVNNIYCVNISCGEKDIEQWWFEITGKKKTYNKISIYLKEKFERAKKQIINNLSKKIYDLAIKNGKWTFLTDEDKLIDA